MTLLTPRARYLHVPKTGGTWIVQALIAGGIPFQPLVTRTGPGSRGHATLAQTAAWDDRFTFAFVRHPLDVYRSRWAGSMRAGWPSGRMLHGCASDDFAEFVENVVQRHPGFASRRYEEFTGPAEAPISFVGRFERLVDDLVEALHRAGESFDEAALRAAAPVNVNDYSVHRAVFSRALADQVLEAERATVERWYRDMPYPAGLVASD